MNNLIGAAWRYRQFILSSIINEFRSSFAQSKIGGLWMILNPLAQVAMYALVLSAVLSAKLPGIENRFSYAIYLTAGTVVWSIFSEVVSRCLTIFISNGNLMKKMVFPRICLPLIVTGTVLVNNLLLLLSVIVIFALLGHYPGIEIVWLPGLMLITIALGLGVGLILGILNVFIRDIGLVVPIVLQFWFWFTPIVYTPSIIPEVYRHWLIYNPMYHLTSAYQNILVFRKPPEWPGLEIVESLMPIGEMNWEGFGLPIVGLSSVILLGMALFMFRQASAEMVDVL